VVVSETILTIARGLAISVIVVTKALLRIGVIAHGVTGPDSSLRSQTAHLSPTTMAIVNIAVKKSVIS